MVGQITYPILMTNASQGLRADSGFGDVISPIAYENIAVGLGVVKVIGTDYQVRLPHQNLTTLTFSGAVGAGDVISGNINGVAITPVPYDGVSSPTTLAIVVAKLVALPTVASASLDVTNLIITITALETAPAITATSWQAVGGTASPTIAMVNGTSDAKAGIYGVALRRQNKMNLYAPTGSAGSSPYYATETVPMLNRGRVYVLSETAVTSDSPVFIRFMSNGVRTTLGNFRGDSDSSTAYQVPNAIWRVGAQAGLLGILEVNV